MTTLTQDEMQTELLKTEGITRSTVVETPLAPEELNKIDAYWRACKYLALGMIYLQANPLLREPLTPEHIKNRLLGHWGSSPGLAIFYTHLNRLIKRDDFEMILVNGNVRLLGSNLRATHNLARNIANAIKQSRGDLG
jgi:xylulose-5-phosphate/fructose-6-phosphate phosphoketolase